MQNEITELRNQVRTLKRIVYGFGCLLVAGIVVSATSMQTVPDVIRAKKFEVVNDEGKVVAMMFVDEDSNGGHILVKDKNQLPLASIKGNKDGGEVVIFDKEDMANAVVLKATPYGGEMSVHYTVFGDTFDYINTVVGKHAQVRIGVDNSGSGNIKTSDNKGQTLVALNSNPNGGIVITRNSKGQRLVQLGTTKNGFGAVTTANGKGQTLVVICSTTNGEGAVETQNGKGQTLVELGSTLEGMGVVVTKNGKGQALAELGSTVEGMGAVLTYNGKGQALVELGTYGGLMGGYVETFTQTGLTSSKSHFHSTK